MTYKEKPVIIIKMDRGETQRVIMQQLIMNGIPISYLDICPKVQFKTAVDINAPVKFEKTVENGGLELDPDLFIMNFNREVQYLPLNVYYGDLLFKADGLNIVGPRFELHLSGTVTSKKEDEC